MGKVAAQRALHCGCGKPKILALGLCASCYTMKRQDEAYFGGLREAVLKRDGYRCRVCDASGRGKRTIIVHHRRPGVSQMDLMISLCPGCHAKVERTQFVKAEMTPLLLVLWREKHPHAQEQIMLAFEAEGRAAELLHLFEDIADLNLNDPRKGYG